jgi:hypothetical protein
MWNFNEQVIGSRLNHSSSKRGSDIHPVAYHSGFPELQQFHSVNFLYSHRKLLKYLKYLSDIIYVRRIVDCAVGIATGYVLDDQGFGVRVPAGVKFFYFPRRSDQLWGPPSFLSIGYRGGGGGLLFTWW